MDYAKFIAQCEKLPIADAINPPQKDGMLFRMIVNRWWCVVDGCLLLYLGVSPQCNPDKAIAERVYSAMGNLEFIERAWIPFRPR